MSKGSLELKDGKLVAGLDTNEDGQQSVGLEIAVGESIKEALAALKKGDVKEVKVEVKTLTYTLDGDRLNVSVDSDKDGEASLTAFVDFSESFEEIAEGIFKK